MYPRVARRIERDDSCLWRATRGLRYRGGIVKRQKVEEGYKRARKERKGNWRLFKKGRGAMVYSAKAFGSTIRRRSERGRWCKQIGKPLLRQNRTGRGCCGYGEEKLIQKRLSIYLEIGAPETQEAFLRSRAFKKSGRPIWLGGKGSQTTSLQNSTERSASWDQR